MTHRKPHDHPAFDTPSPAHPASLPYASFDEAVLAGDMATADLYFAHENRTAFWLDSVIVMRKQTAAHYDPNKPADAWNNNATTAEYAGKLVTALEAYKAHRG
jgi:hypothetical protein